MTVTQADWLLTIAVALQLVALVALAIDTACSVRRLYRALAAFLDGRA